MGNHKDELVAALQRIEQRLGSLERWLRFANMDKLRAILETELSEDRKKLVYEYSDGSRGYREVGQLAGVPAPTVQMWWARWFTIGIMEPSPTRAGRVQRIYSLRDVGLDVPVAPRQKPQPKAHSQKLRDEASNQSMVTEGGNNGNRESK
jgi:hypothetical protein